MATHRNRYIKVHLFEPCSTRIQDAKVVGQSDDYLLLERAQPKPRPATAAAKTRKRKGSTPPASANPPAPEATRA